MSKKCREFDELVKDDKVAVALGLVLLSKCLNNFREQVRDLLSEMQLKEIDLLVKMVDSVGMRAAGMLSAKEVAAFVSLSQGE